MFSSVSALKIGFLMIPLDEFKLFSYFNWNNEERGLFFSSFQSEFS